jgi:1-acyl-sn-glycerol-3-phosphate acyltransferase
MSGIGTQSSLTRATPVQPRSAPDALPSIEIRARFIRVLQRLAFYGAYFIFGGLGVITSLVCLIPARFLDSRRSHHFGQELIHKLFRFFTWYLRTFGLLHVDASGIAGLRDEQGIILVANHPSLLDAVLVTAQQPRLFCLMKADLAHNIVLSGQSRLAGYVHNKSAVGLIKACTARISEGSNFLVFPEGTRSKGRLGVFKMGFTLLACTLRRPVQTIIIRFDQSYLSKGWPFLQAPDFPVRCSLCLGRRFEPLAATDARSFGKQIEDYMREMVDTP